MPSTLVGVPSPPPEEGSCSFRYHNPNEPILVDSMICGLELVFVHFGSCSVGLRDLPCHGRGRRGRGRHGTLPSCCFRSKVHINRSFDLGHATREGARNAYCNFGPILARSLACMHAFHPVGAMVLAFHVHSGWSSGAKQAQGVHGRNRHRKYPISC